MNRYEMLSKSNEIRSKMIDEESVRLYDARIDFLLDRFFFQYTKATFDIGRTWNISELDVAMKLNPGTETIVIFGTGDKGDFTRRLLYRSEYSGRDIVFYDRNKTLWGRNIEIVVGNDRLLTEVISEAELKKRIGKAVVVIAVDNNTPAAFDHIHDLFVPIQKVVYPHSIHSHLLYGRTGWQYFDMFGPGEKEVFLDVGAFDGGTSADFCRWCDGKYDGIIALEANKAMAQVCRDRFEKLGLHDAELVEKAAWDKAETLRFNIDEGIYQGGCKVSDSGKVMVEADSIDNILNGRRVSFIKMDIEGSELKALLGAEQTIREFKPRLAISIYHMRKDIVDIPYVINEFNPDYEFAIRQYATYMEETVLYAL